MRSPLTNPGFSGNLSSTTLVQTQLMLPSGDVLEDLQMMKSLAEIQPLAN